MALVLKKNRVLISILVLWLMSCPFSLSADSGEIAQYYSKLEVRTVNRVVTGTRLVILPAREEYRTEKFERVKVYGEAVSSPTLDMESAAKHAALSNLLMERGLKSIRSRGVVRNSKNFDEATLFYEGVVKAPMNTLQTGYDRDTLTCKVEMELLFSPIAFPDRWSFLYIKSLFNKSFHESTSLFHSDSL